jgi:HlyD family secretion protein
MKKKWMVFAAVVLFLAAGGLGLYLGTPAIPKRSREQSVPVQSVASLTGYAEAEALRSRFLGVLSRKEAVSVQLDSGRENEGFLVEAGDLVEEGTVLAVYDNASLLLDREQLLLDREQMAFDVENANLQIRTLKRERSQAEAAQRGDYDLQILNAEAELSQKEYDLSRKDREIAALEETLSEKEVVSPCKGVVEEVDREGGSLSIVPEDVYEFTFQAGEEEIREFQAGDAVRLTSRDGSLVLAGTIDRTGTESPSESETASGAARASLYPVSGTVTGAGAFLPGQHVYVEKEEDAQEETTLEGAAGGLDGAPLEGGNGPEGETDDSGETNDSGEAEILLPEGYVEDASGKPWVWAAGEDSRLEKRPVTLGAYNDRHNAWQVEEGLSMTDYLAWPSALLEEGQEADFGE